LPVAVFVSSPPHPANAAAVTSSASMSFVDWRKVVAF